MMAASSGLHEVLNNVYVGGIDSADAALLKEHGITAVLSVLRQAPVLPEVDQLVVEIDDLEEADLLSHLPKCMEFIYERSKSAPVLVHCQAGCSRSAAVIMAYLIATEKKTVADALETVRLARPEAGPNEGFLKQLGLWERMGCRLDTNNPQYRLHCLQNMAARRLDGTLSGADLVAGLEGGENGEWRYRCKMCRKQLFTEQNVIPHDLGVGQEAFRWHKREDPMALKNKQSESNCTSFFVQPIRWMAADIVGASVYDGKLHCDKCKSRVGNFNWSGAQCSCGRWVSPAFEVHKKKVDAMFTR